MDAVVKGLIGGSAISLILFFGGVISMSTTFAETFKNPGTIGIWLIVLTALTAGQLFLTAMIVSAFAEAPPQRAGSTSE
jgi:hypothetical protein